MNCPKCTTPMQSANFFASSTQRFVCPSCSHVEKVEATPETATETPAPTATPTAASTPTPAPAAAATTASDDTPATTATIYRAATSGREYDEIRDEGPFPIPVRDLHSRYRDRLDLGGQTVVYVNGAAAQADQQVKAGDYVTFRERMKERGN